MFRQLHRPRRSALLYAGCQIDCVPHGFVVHAQVVANGTNDHWPGIDPYPQM
jgi:hypothetical protein